MAKDRFSGADMGGRSGVVLGAENGGWFGVDFGRVGHEGGNLIAAEGAHKGVFFVDELGSLG